MKSVVTGFLKADNVLKIVEPLGWKLKHIIVEDDGIILALCLPVEEPAKTE